MLNYHLRQFRGKSNSANGEVSPHTVFTYYQQGDRLWGEYAGGDIRRGHLQGKVQPDGSLFFCITMKIRRANAWLGNATHRPA